MTPAPKHAAIQELLGVYAINAVDDGERALVGEHLPSCPRCRAELVDHRETAAMLAFAGQTAPAGLWEQISAQLEDAPPPVPLELAFARRNADVIAMADRPRRSTLVRWSAGLVAAAAVVISLLALSVSLRDDGGGRSRSFEAAVAGEPRIELASADGRHSAHVVVADGRGYLFNDNLPVLPDEQVYQLWGRKGADLISLGLLGTDPEQEEFVAGEQFEAYAITVEQAGGVVRSDQLPVVAGRAVTS